jgi:hypothetical protein
MLRKKKSIWGFFFFFSDPFKTLATRTPFAFSCQFLRCLLYVFFNHSLDQRKKKKKLRRYDRGRAEKGARQGACLHYFIFKKIIVLASTDFSIN